MIDTSHSKQKGWYAQELMDDYETLISRYQSAPVTTNKGEPSVNHRHHPAKFEYYDMMVEERDPKTNEFSDRHLKNWSKGSGKF